MIFVINFNNFAGREDCKILLYFCSKLHISYLTNWPVLPSGGASLSVGRVGGGGVGGPHCHVGRPGGDHNSITPLHYLSAEVLTPGWPGSD